MWPRWMLPAAIIAGLLALLPFGLIARARMSTSARPRLHAVPDMDNQPKYKAQMANPFFADGRAMRPAVPGTVARGPVDDDPRYFHGLESMTWTGDTPPWVRTSPVPITPALVKRGQERFNIFCAPCHGLDGQGDGIVSQRAQKLTEGSTWTPPPSYYQDLVLQRPDGHLFNTITNGIRSMPAYATQIPVADRWAIVAYIRALQRSRDARIDEVPAADRGKLY